MKFAEFVSVPIRGLFNLTYTFCILCFIVSYSFRPHQGII